MNGRLRRRLLIFGLAFAVTACGPAPDQPAGPPADPVVVYSNFADKSLLPALLDNYTKQTGVMVIVRHGSEAAIVDDVIDNQITPPADLLITRGVSGVWRAAEEGALRPIRSETLATALPDWLRDPDNFWFALNYRPAVIVANRSIANSPPGDYASLADAAHRGRLCLGPAALPHNQAVIAALIDRLGVRDAEIAVRAWMANLAGPVIDGEQDLLDALISGDCGIALASAAASDDTNLVVQMPANHAGDGDAAAVARHARNADGAARLLEWLVSDSAQRGLAAARESQAAIDAAPDSPRNISVTAWRKEEAQKLVERVRYR